MNSKLTYTERENFDLLHNDRVLVAKALDRPDFRGFWASVTDKYKEKAHFVYELLQNADDAQATEAIFKLENDRLVFRHNGKIQFSVVSVKDTENKGHINAITGVGFSTKEGSRGNTIGKFGVGFKAVFQYTNTPFIYDDKFWFKIEQYIIPTMLEDDFPDRRKGETVFVFPFTSPSTSYKEIDNRLKTLENPILFLHHLQKVTIEIPGEDAITYTKNVLYEHQHGSIKHELLSVRNNGSIKTIHMFTKNIDVKLKNGVETTQYISVGYFLKDNGDIDDEIQGKVFCFFPTAEDFNLHCIVHAPFLLVDSRQQLKDDILNYKFKGFLAKLAADALPILRDYGKKIHHLLITENIFNLIPKKEIWYSKDQQFRDEYITAIRNNKLLLGRGNRYTSHEGALICRPISMMSVVDDKQLQMLHEDKESHDNIQYTFLREETQRLCTQKYVQSILEELDVDEYDGKDLASEITSEFMEIYGFKWAKKLYNHLRHEQVKLWKKPANAKLNVEDTPFCVSPIILTTKGTWEKPYNRNGSLNVYLPLITDIDKYLFVASEYLKEEETKTFLKDLGLKEPDSWDYIQSVILKKHEQGDQFDDDEICDDLCLVYDYISKISNESEREEKTSVIAKDLLLMDEGEYLFIASELYENTISLKKYFRDTKYYIGEKKYKKFVDKYSIQEFHAFIQQLGVAIHPRILKKERTMLDYLEQQRLSIGRYTSCHFYDYILEGFENARNRGLETSKKIWEWLSEFENLEMYRTTTFKYFYYSDHSKEIPTTLFYQLVNTEWIYLKDGKAYKPSDISIEDLEDAEYKIDYRLVKLFNIERKTKSLEELGASESQIRQNKIGKLAAELGLDNLNDLIEASQALVEKRQKEAAARRAPQEQTDKRKQEEDESSPLHSNQRKTDLGEMSSSSKQYQERTPRVEKSQDERVSDITQKLADEANRRIEEENKRAQVGDLEKYSKVWFKTLLELEYNSSSESTGNRNGVKITFDRFRKETGSDRIYQLANPSRSIPIWIEDLGGFAVKFTFFNRDDITFDFEVANVKDFTLRVKAKASDVELIDKIDWSHCSKAVIDVNSPIEIMHKLKTEFENLPYEDDYNFRDCLTDNLSFVFGPPGTGKTTRLAEIICHKMELDNCRILVLAPTNKACDVLTRKLIEMSEEDYSWLGRFVATGEEYIENSGSLIDRASELYTRDKCCIVSTMARLPYDGFTQSPDHELLRDIKWDFIIVDEASMIPLVQMVYAIYKLDTKIIVAGDPLQIAPIVREEGWMGENIYTMVKLDNFESSKTVPIQFNVEKLGLQYRSLPSIGTLYSEYCYNGKLKHNRTQKDSRNLPTGSIKAKQVNFVPFRVERFDSIFGAKKLQGSNVHVYSAIFSVEMCAYLAKAQISEDVRIGVICPYAPQAQLINKMIEQRTDIPSNVEILVGTIHGFQGDQCDMIITVLNPPTGIKVAADRIMLNNRNILNVAISRASDYLFVLLPHPDSYGYENLIEINKLCGIANRKCSSVALFNSEVIEKAIFNKRDFIESNTFVTTHQVANVYTSASALYEVRIDENAVDIQTAGQCYQSQRTVLTTPNTVAKPQIPDVAEKSRFIPELAHVDIKQEPANKEAKPQISDNTCTFNSEEQYYRYFKDNNTDLDNALLTLFKDPTLCALYTLMRIFGNKDIPQQFGWGRLDEEDVKRCRKISSYSELGKFIYPLLFFAIRGQQIPLKEIGHKKITEITFAEFVSSVKATIERMKTKMKRPRIHETNIRYNSAYTQTYQRKESSGNLYDTFEYGMSDW